MNKDLINSLIKVASSLDSIGLVKEASVVDRIAQELSPGNNVASMDYKTDIIKYKSLLQSGNLQAANILKDNVISKYDEQKKLAFLAQANKIQDQLGNKYNKLSNITDDQLNNLLVRYKIYDAADLKSFNLSWNKMMQDLKSKNFVNDDNDRIFIMTYRNLAAKFGYTRFNSNITGNFNTDMDNYARLILNRLFTEASSLLSQVFNSNKYSRQQKEIFKLKADSYFNSLENQSNKDFNYAGIDEKALISDAKDLGVYSAKNINEFNAAWKKLLNYYKTEKFTVDEKNPQAPTMYKTPGVAYQLENFRKEIMIQKGFTKLPSN
jgi:hypothetical protein